METWLVPLCTHSFCELTKLGENDYHNLDLFEERNANELTNRRNYTKCVLFALGGDFIRMVALLALACRSIVIPPF